MWESLHAQIFMGSASFIKQMQGLIDASPPLREVPRLQTRPLKAGRVPDAATRDTEMARAYQAGLHTMGDIAKRYGVHVATVSRAVARVEATRHADASRRAKQH